MIVQIIGGCCLAHVMLGEIALLSSVIDKDVTEPGAKIKVGFLNMGYLALAIWCFK